MVNRLGVLLTVDQASPAPGDGLRTPAVDDEDCGAGQYDETSHDPAPWKPPHGKHALSLSGMLGPGCNNACTASASRRRSSHISSSCRRSAPLLRSSSSQERMKRKT